MATFSTRPQTGQGLISWTAGWDQISSPRLLRLGTITARPASLLPHLAHAARWAWRLACLAKTQVLASARPRAGARASAAKALIKLASLLKVLDDVKDCTAGATR